MFTGKMVTEAIPARVFALYKIVTSKKYFSISFTRVNGTKRNI